MSAVILSTLALLKDHVLRLTGWDPLILIRPPVQISLIFFGVVTAFSLVRRAAPYGRHTPAQGRVVPCALGWLGMESPSVYTMLCGLYFASAPMNLPAALLAGLWLAHYVHRAFIYPFRMGAPDKPMAAKAAVAAFVFCTINGYTNTLQLWTRAYPESWLWDPRFCVGTALFVVGYVLNLHADTILLNLRKPGETGYVAPHGGLFRYVTNPNYFGEILEWGGWALASWSWPGLTFFAWTLLNLIPRAVSNHRWYEARFPDYARGRSILIPGLF